MKKTLRHRIADAEYNSRTRVQFNTNELHNLLQGYKESLCGIVDSNSLTVKLERALARCKKKANAVLKARRG